MWNETINSQFSNRTSIFLLLIFITIFTFLGAGKAFDHQINHQSPTGFMASDAFTHNWVAQNTYDTGYQNQPPNYAFGNEIEFLEQTGNYKLFHPPILPLLTASIAKMSGLHVYDANIILVFLLVVLIVVMNYFIISRFNETLALLSLPFSLLFISGKFFISLTWGWWDFLIGEFFLFSFFIILINEKFKERYLLIALLITAAMMAHGVEAAYAVIFVIFYLGFHLIFIRKEIYPLIKEQIKTGFLVLLIGGYSINIFLKTMGSMGYSQLEFVSYSKIVSNIESWFIFFSEFYYFQYLIIVGYLILAYFIIRKKDRLLVYYFFAIFMSLSLYFYSPSRALQWRFLWPVYLSFSGGAVLYLVYLFTQKTIPKIIHWRTLFFFGSLVSFMIIIFPLPFQGPGLIDPLDYDSYQWVYQNTDIHSRFFIMFTPLDSQISRLYLIKRDLFISTTESWKSISLKSSKIENLKNHPPVAGFFCKKDDCSLFKESHFLESHDEMNKHYFKNTSICDLDYIYLNFKNQPEIHAKNVDYLNFLISKNISRIVFNNQQIVIAKNVLKGEQCEAKFKS